MDLNQTQALLARLYTDPEFIVRFCEEPSFSEQWARQTGSSMEVLERVPRDQVKMFALALRQKRLNELSKLMPLTFHALGADAFRELFQEFKTRSGPGRHAEARPEAILFANFAAQHCASVGHWFAEACARYERARLSMMRPKARCSWVRLPCSEWELHRGSADSVRRSMTLVVWFRLTRRGPLRNFVYSLPSFHVRS
jgi:hypothetical protein